MIAECLRAQTHAPPRSSLARLLGRSPLSDESRPWYVGALGELDVARRLESLGPGWTVLHSVPIGTRGSDIDHLVVGPAGVFTINTKFHEGARVWVASRRLLVNGQAKDHLRNARFETTRTQKLLSAASGTEVPVRGLIAIVGAKEIKIRERPEDVTVLAETQLTRWVKRQKPRLDQTQLSTLAELVCNAPTWTSEPSPPADTSAFADLRREVTTAHRVRMLWGAALLVTALGIVIPTAISFSTRMLGG